MEEKKNSTLVSKALEAIRTAVLMIAVYIIVTSSFGLTKVIGESMSPTLKHGSLLAVNRLSAHFGTPQPGDVVILRPENMDYNIVKRVIGLPGDRVRIEDGTVYVNDVPLPEIYTLGEADDMPEVKVMDDCIYVLGDNRTPGESLDSRDTSIGALPMRDIQGYAMMSLFPMYRIMKPLEF